MFRELTVYGHQLSQFRDLIQDFDPTGKFRNAFLDRFILGSSDGHQEMNQ